MSSLLDPRPLDIIVLAVAVCLGVVILRHVTAKSRTTKLRGPPRKSWFWGYNRELMAQLTSGSSFERWAAEYSSCFLLPVELGKKRLILTDPKAIAYVLTNDNKYRRPEGSKALNRKLLGKGITSAEGDDHKRMRKALNPGFTPQALRHYVPTFFESAHKVEEAWNAALVDQKEGTVTVDVQKWMNSISLDTIGLAGFSHDFGTLHGERPLVAVVMASLGSQRLDFLSALTFLLLQTVPQILKLPSPRNKLFSALNESTSGVAKIMLSKARQDKSATQDHYSMLGPLLKAEGSKITTSELSSQMNTLILAGFETTSNSLSWCLHELSMHPEWQQRIRDELAMFPEPTYEQLVSQMPITEAIVRETLRTHPPVPDQNRVCVEDDVIPLFKPLTTEDGTVVDHIDISSGQGVTIAIEAVNKSELVWGPTAHEYDPERWLKAELPALAQEVQGYHHLLTFADGPKNCIGKHFAVLEMKVVLSILMRRFAFEPSDGTGQNVITHRGFFPRPQTKGMEGGILMMRVRPVEA